MSRLTRLPTSLYALLLVIVLFIFYSQLDLLLGKSYSSYVYRISASLQRSPNDPLHDEYKARI